MSEKIAYPGKELELFSEASNWKKYLAEELKPFIRGDVLEVGPGLGSMTKVLLPQADYNSWTLLEPDPRMADGLTAKISRKELPEAKLVQGTLSSLKGSLFDCILYIDVLEHIADDQDEIRMAAELLRPGGKLVVLSPAWQFLFSPFDKAIGHHRRYSRKDLNRLKDPSLELLNSRYLDSLGAIASLANRLLLRQEYPNLGQVLFWDRYLVPASRLADVFSLHVFGKSILMVWEKQN